ncbi:hypothetical protein [Nocardia altamirensis]|uniref:hypothetical protein n=1 Tax=Nocardia altamirensis TaxID=472158 RepID=UPI00114C8B2A|nr:hypothetical protein [Nocardia altamirensis]
MPEEIQGKTFRSPDEVEPLPAEEIARLKAEFAAFNARRDAVPEEERIHLRDHFGDDAIGTDREDEYRKQVEERKKRGEYWG